MKLVNSRPPLSPRLAGAQKPAYWFVQPGGSLVLLPSFQVVGPRPVHGAGAILSLIVVASMALNYLRGHDRASVSQPEMRWVSSATCCKQRSQIRPLGSSGSPHTDRYSLLSHALIREPHRFPHLSRHVLLFVIISSLVRRRGRSRSLSLLLSLVLSPVRLDWLVSTSVRGPIFPLLPVSAEMWRMVVAISSAVDDTSPSVADGLVEGASVSLTPTRVAASLTERDRRSNSSSPCRGSRSRFVRLRVLSVSLVCSSGVRDSRPRSCGRQGSIPHLSASRLSCQYLSPGKNLCLLLVTTLDLLPSSLSVVL